MAKIFGDTDDIMVYAADIHIDHNTHELIVEAHDGKGDGLVHVATELGHEHSEKTAMEHRERAVSGEVV